MIASEDRLADAEFVGLFMGEGHLDLVRVGNTSRALAPRVRIAMRDDDVAILRWCQVRFGGSLSPRASMRSLCWQLTGKAAVREVIDVLLTSRLPAKKMAEVVLMSEAVDLVGPRGKNASPSAAARQHAIRDELKALRAYKEGA